MGRCWGLVLFGLVISLMQELSYGEKSNGSCSPSSCGIITNISYPFRLPNDPTNCGDQKYELACQNNVTVLNLYWGRYYVLGINYKNLTIRLLDPGIQNDDCSSLPHHSLYDFNFTQYFDPYSNRPYPSLVPPDSSNYIVYLNCMSGDDEDAITEYVDTTPCVNWRSKGHLYAVVGNLLVSNFTNECHVVLVTPIDASSDSLRRMKKNSSYAQIHRVLSYGFELSWWPRVCDDIICPPDFCGFDSTSHQLYCDDQKSYCRTPLGFDIYNCSRVSKLRILVEDYLFGVFKGLRQIKGPGEYEHSTDYDFSLALNVMDMGTFTGRFILPYITVRFLLGFTFLLALLIHTCRRRHFSMFEIIEDFLQLHNLEPIRYSYKELKIMSKGFKNKLGQGGFGTVYQGKLRSGHDVAIKMLDTSKASDLEFISEVATIGRIHHVHVVQLVGFCVEGSKRALVYEFMPNGSLDKYIFSKDGSFPLSYHKIYEISLGVARGIAYLHHGCDMQILHFDIKPHNILLDDDFTPKVSDFGLAKLYPVDDTIGTLTAVRGTIGYMAPELFYKNIGRVSYKADVYSFGMLLMEMAGRRRNLNSDAEHSSQLYFPLWIYDQFTYEKDVEIEGLTKEEKDLARKMFIVAFWCIQLKPVDRPSMHKVVEMLEAQVESLEMPPKPSLYPQETMVGDHELYSHQTASCDSIHSSSCASDIILEDSTSSAEQIICK